MEADWAAEVGADLPVIDADWAGCMDLLANPEQVGRIEEAAQHPALREALLRLNAPESPVRTSKCDVWALDAAEVDPPEFGCVLNTTFVGLACYVDLVARDAELFGSFERHESWAVASVRRMRLAESGSGRVDLVIRAAHAAGRDGFGLTLYAAGCGEDARVAQAAWSAILQVATTITMGEAPAIGASSSIG
jgi:hypothetical protein